MLIPKETRYASFNKCITLKHSFKTDTTAINPAQLDSADIANFRHASDHTTFGFRVRYFDIKGLGLKN
jgi:hypothetical protein